MYTEDDLKPQREMKSEVMSTQMKEVRVRMILNVITIQGACPTP